MGVAIGANDFNDGDGGCWGGGGVGGCDYFMTCSIVEGNIKQIKDPVKYVESKILTQHLLITLKTQLQLWIYYRN